MFKVLIGPTGRVYKAQGFGGEMVALKKSHVTKHVTSPMLRHEACALSLLAGHPSIPRVYAWGRSQYYEYLAMDLLGSPSQSVSTQPKRLELRSVLSLLVQMVRRFSCDLKFLTTFPQLDSLQHIHSHHVVHLDIKPVNILFGIGSQAERMSLIDYGFARYYRDPLSLVHRPLEENRKFLGTVQYASLNAHIGFSTIILF